MHLTMLGQDKQSISIIGSHARGERSPVWIPVDLQFIYENRGTDKSFIDELGELYTLEFLSHPEILFDAQPTEWVTEMKQQLISTKGVSKLKADLKNLIKHLKF